MKAARIWLWLAVTSGVLLGSVFVTQFSAASSRDLDEVCEAAGRFLDRNFRLMHPYDGSLRFPLHNRCDAVYDIVPAWVNPSMSALAAVLALSLAGALISRNTRRTYPG
jgi:hypothetical protein